MWQPYDPRDRGVDALERWIRKHYRFEILNGGNFDCCTGTCVKLEAAGRVVEVDYSELVRWDLDETHGGDYFPTVDDLLKEAVRRWHADPTPRLHRVSYLHASYPKWWSLNEQIVTAANEVEAVAAVERGVDYPITVVAVREVFVKE